MLRGKPPSAGDRRVEERKWRGLPTELALAAAYAANGQPRQAVDVCESALRVAASDPTVGEQLEAEMRERLAHYKKVLEAR